jgi:Homing endonuclease associated repeat
MPRYAVERRPSGPAGGPPAIRRERRYSREAVLEAIRRWAEHHDGPPTSLDWDPARARRQGHEWRAERFEAGRWPTIRMVRDHFGTFNDAVARAGLEPRRAPSRVRPNLVGPEAILAAVVEWTRRYGDLPAMADWDPVRARRLGQTWRIARYLEDDWPSARTVAHHFGSFSAAAAAAGLVPRARSSTGSERADARRRNRVAVAASVADVVESGHHASSLATAVRAVAAGRRAGDPVALHAALIELAAAALADAEVASAGD